MKKTQNQLIRQLQLKHVNSNFKFSEQMYKASNNELWKNKLGLWKLLEAACDDAAVKCYTKIKSMTDQLANVETCNVTALVSMANSVDASNLVNDIIADDLIIKNIDPQIQELIDIFSIQKQILLNSNTILANSSNNKVSGFLTVRGSNYNNQKVPIDLLYQIKQNSKYLYHLFSENLIDPQDVPTNDRILQTLLKQDLDDLSLEKLKNTPKSSIPVSGAVKQEDLYKTLKNKRVENILNEIYKCDFDHLKIFCQQKLLVNKRQIEQDIVYDINYFYLLINILKQNYYQSNTNYYFKTMYLDEQSKQVINLGKLIFNIVGMFQNDNEIYLQNFIQFHFFNVIVQKLYNQKLIDLYQTKFDTSKNQVVYTMKQSVINDMSQQEFKNRLLIYMENETNVDKFIQLNKIIKYKKQIITFVKTLFLIGQLPRAAFKKEDLTKIHQYSILRINFHNFFNDNNPYHLFNADGKIFLLARKYTDYCLQIQKIRNDLKQLIQQYSYIGTKRVATDLLYEFFIKNYSKNESAGYTIPNKNMDAFNTLVVASADLINNKIIANELCPAPSLSSLTNIQRKYDELLHGTSGEYDDNFSIKIIQYYDDTKYLNIQSDMPSTVVSRYIVDYLSNTGYMLNSNNIIVSSIIETPVYQEVSAPCSNFVTNYNQKFWDSKTLNLNKNVNSVIENQINYINLYQQYDKNLSECTTQVYKETYINQELKPLFNKIWDTFALSSVSDGELDTTYYGTLYKKYIGNGLGDNNLLNHENKIFPTIAAFQNFNGLIQIDQFNKENILFISKVYYQNLFEKVKKATLNFFKMYSQNGIPIEGWRREYVTFHGYANSYQQSSNKLPFSLKQGKLYKNNGPFIYEKLQEFLYNYQLHQDGSLSGENINISSFVKQFCYSTKTFQQSYKTISGYYQYYLNDDTSFINPSGIISTMKISQYEEDEFENCFTLFKQDGEITGKLIYRSYKMPISIPLMNEKITGSFIDEDDQLIQLSSVFKFQHIVNNGSQQQKQEIKIQTAKMFNIIFNHCIEFGFLNKMFWIFGKYNNDYYKLFSFKYQTDYNGKLLVDVSSINNYTYNLNSYIYYLNDYIGTYTNNDTLNFLLFSNDDAILSLKNCQTQEQKREALTNTDLKIEKITLDTKTNNYTLKFLKQANRGDQNAIHPLMPMILDHYYKFVDDVSGVVVGSVKGKDISGFLNNYSLLNFAVDTQNISGKISGIIDEKQTYIPMQWVDQGNGHYTKKIKIFTDAQFSKDQLIITNPDLISETSEITNFKFANPIIHAIEINGNDNTQTIGPKDQNTYKLILKTLLSYSICKNNINNQKERLWKLDKNQQNCFIMYKALNKQIVDSDIGTFSYYFKGNPNVFEIETMNAQWDYSVSFVDINESLKTNLLAFNLQNNQQALINDIQDYPETIQEASNYQFTEKQIDIVNKLMNLSNCYLQNTKLRSKFTAFNIGYEYSDEFLYRFLLPFIIKDIKQKRYGMNRFDNYCLTFQRMGGENGLIKQAYQKFNQKYGSDPTMLIFKNQNISKEKQISRLLESYQEAMDIYNTVSVDTSFQITRQTFMDQYSSIFEATNEYYKLLPALKTCCVQPLNIKIVFQNDTDITFLNDGVIDLDIGCYINDVQQKNKRVGYWQGYRKTQYIKWDGDVTNGGFEQLNIDIEKYILNHQSSYQPIEICLNTCWHQNSQITPDNVYILITWNHFVQKYPITLIGSSTKDCKTKTCSIFIDKITKQITIDQNYLYPVLKLNKRKLLAGYLSTADIEMGVINLNNNDLKNIETTHGWKKYSKNIYYKIDINNQKNILFMFTDINSTINYKYPAEIYQKYKSILENNLYISRNGSSRKFWDLTLNDLYAEKPATNDDIEWNYIVYLNPSYFNKSFEDLNYKIEVLLHDDLLKINNGQIDDKKTYYELHYDEFENLKIRLQKLRFRVNVFSSNNVEGPVVNAKEELDSIKYELSELKRLANQIDLNELQKNRKQDLINIKEQIDEIEQKLK